MNIEGDLISLRDIIINFKKFLEYNKLSGIINLKFKVLLHTLDCTYPIEYLLFDYCLAALDNDLLDSKLYLDHAYNIMRFNHNFYLILNVIVSEQIIKDKDSQTFLAKFAQTIEPASASVYVKQYGDGFKRRYNKYKQILNKN